MKFFFLKLVFFLTLVSAFIFALESFDNNLPSLDGNVIRLKNSVHYDSLDFLFVGPSYNYCSIKPSMFDSLNIKTYNIGVATAGVYYYNLIIKNYLNATRVKPKNIVLSFSLITFSDIASDNWDNYPIHRYLAKPLSNEKVCLSYGSFKRYPAMLKNSIRKSILGFWNGQKKISAEVYDSIIRLRDSLKGYDFRPVTFFSDSLYEADKTKYEPFLQDDFSENRRRAFYELIDEIRKKGINVILLESPTFRVKDFFNTSFKHRFERFKIELLQKNVTVISISGMNDAKLYSNIDHCNDLGAIRFTSSLISHLIP